MMEEEFADLIGFSFAPDGDADESFKTQVSALSDLACFEHEHNVLANSAKKADDFEEARMPADYACWGAHLKQLQRGGNAHACDDAFVRGAGHLKNKFCQHCRAGIFEVPVTHCRAVTPALEAVLYNNTAAGFWTSLEKHMGDSFYRSINSTKSCTGPGLLVFDRPVTAELDWAPLPTEWLSEDGTTMSLVLALGSIVPHGSIRVRAKRGPPHKRAYPPAKRRPSRTHATIVESSASSTSSTTASICGEARLDFDDADLLLDFDDALDVPPLMPMTGGSGIADVPPDASALATPRAHVLVAPHPLLLPLPAPSLSAATKAASCFAAAFSARHAAAAAARLLPSRQPPPRRHSVCRAPTPPVVFFEVAEAPEAQAAACPPALAAAGASTLVALAPLPPPPPPVGAPSPTVVGALAPPVFGALAPPVPVVGAPAPSMAGLLAPGCSPTCAMVCPPAPTCWHIFGPSMQSVLAPEQLAAEQLRAAAAAPALPRPLPQRPPSVGASSGGSAPSAAFFRGLPWPPTAFGPGAASGGSAPAGVTAGPEPAAASLTPEEPKAAEGRGGPWEAAEASLTPEESLRLARQRLLELQATAAALEASRAAAHAARVASALAEERAAHSTSMAAARAASRGDPSEGGGARDVASAEADVETLMTEVSCDQSQPTALRQPPPPHLIPSVTCRCLLMPADAC